MQVEIYTDGACSGNPGRGGWGVVMMCGDRYKELSGAEAETTNNRMELQAVISGFLALKKPCSVTVYSDSAYVINAFTQNWISSWIAKGWKTSTGAVKNIDLWQELLRVSQSYTVTWKKVKGHSDNRYNNRCDELARAAIRDMKKEVE